MAFKKITDTDVKGKGNVGRPDTPGVSTAEMQRIMDEIPREVIIPAFNALIDALADKTSAATLGITAPEGIAGSTVQEVVNALLAYVNAHKNDQENPHAVTAAQVDAYTKKQTDDAIDKKVTEIDSGDMAQAVYDPTGQRKDVFAAINTAIIEALATTMLRATYDPQGKNTDVFAYTDEKSAAILKKVEQLTSANAGAHNAIYRGKYLGESVTAAQYAAISAGTFDDLYIGDYWTIDSVNYRIAAFDYYLNCGDTACTTHHVVIVPDTCLYNAAMNSTATTTGGYVGSAMHKSNLEQAKTTIKSAFSGHVLNHRINLTNAVANGCATGSAFCDSEVDLMCAQMVYGSGIFSPVSDGSRVPANYRVEKSQLPLFQHEPGRICNFTTWWLRDVITGSIFARVGNNGNAGYFTANHSDGVRPAFCVY